MKPGNLTVSLIFLPYLRDNTRHPAASRRVSPRVFHLALSRITTAWLPRAANADSVTYRSCHNSRCPRRSVAWVYLNFIIYDRSTDTRWSGASICLRRSIRQYLETRTNSHSVGFNQKRVCARARLNLKDGLYISLTNFFRSEREINIENPAIAGNTAASLSYHFQDTAGTFIRTIYHQEYKQRL